VTDAPIIIIGTGLAGYSVARELRKLSSHPLVMISADDGRYYSKPMLSNAYTSGKTPDTIAIASAEKMAEQLNAEIRTQQIVSAIDPEQCSVTSSAGSLNYSSLVLALGADPIAIPVAGDGIDRVYSVNDLQDYGRFRTAIAAAKHIVIMGAGLIGCEFANDLASAGIAVDVVDPAPYPLNRFLPEPAGRALEAALANLNVRWRLGTTLKTVNHEGARLVVTYADGTTCTTDAVLSAVGLRPRIDLARAAGLAVNRGIVVDRTLATTDPKVFAIGDCAEVEGLVLPFVMPIMQAARALAQTLAGNHTPVKYPAMPVIVKTTAYPVIVSPPPANAVGRWDSQSTAEGGIRSLFYGAQDQLLGFALTGTAVQEKNALTKELPALLNENPVEVRQQ
jgi:rubredoxin---NAD+ reductase